MEEERKTKYTEMLNRFYPFGIGCMLYGILFTICLYKGFHGISMPVLIAATICGLFIVMKKLGTEFKKSDVFYMVCLQLLGISSCLTGDMYLIFFNVCGIVLLILSWLLCRFCDTAGWGFPKYLKEILNGIFVPIGYLNGFVKSAYRYFSDKDKEQTESSKAKYIWLGVLLGIPFVMVVTSLLVSADAVFGNIFKNLFQNIHLPERPIWLIILLVIGIFGSFAILGYFADEKISCEKQEHRTWEPMIAIAFLSFSTVVYLIFSVVQILYLFIGGFQLPDGYTYATYAHEGFYQLLAVCLINLIVLFICIGKFRESLCLKIILTIFSVCTYIMLASSVFRMILYVKVYQLTYLRLMTLWGLLVIGIVLAGCMITIWKNSFFLFQYAMIVVTVLYIMLSFARPGYIIAKYNLSDPNAKVDINYLLDMNSDVIPVLLESAQFEEMLSEEKDEYKMRNYQKLNQEMGVTDFNFSYYSANKKIVQKVGNIE